MAPMFVLEYVFVPMPHFPGTGGTAKKRRIKEVVKYCAGLVGVIIAPFLAMPWLNTPVSASNIGLSDSIVDI